MSKLPEIQKAIYKNEKDTVAARAQKAKAEKEYTAWVKDKDLENLGPADRVKLYGRSRAVKNAAQKIQKLGNQHQQFNAAYIKRFDQVQNLEKQYQNAIKADVNVKQIPKALRNAHQEYAKYQQVVKEHNASIKSELAKKQRKQQQAAMINKAVKETNKKWQAADLKKKQELAEKEEEEKNKEYKSERDQFYKALDSFMSSPELLTNIIDPFAETKSDDGRLVGKVHRLVGEDRQVGNLEYASALVAATKYVGKNSVSVVRVVTSAPHYLREGRKIKDGRTPKPEDTSFFLRLVDDPETITFLANKGDKVTAMVEEVAPTVVSTAMRQFGRVADVEAKRQKFIKKFGTLEQIEKKIESELAREKADPKNFKEKDQKNLEKLTKKRKELKSLDARLKRAKLVRDLGGVGVDSAYISDNLLPILINPMKHTLEDPARLMSMASAGIDVAYEKDPQKRREAIREVAGHLDMNALLESSDLSKFLHEEAETLGKVAVVVGSNIEVVKTQLNRFGVSKALVADGVAMGSKLASSAIASQDQRVAVTEMYQAGLAVITDGVTPELRDKFIAGGVKLLRDERFQHTLQAEVPQFLKDHQKDIAKVVSKAIDNTALAATLKAQGVSKQMVLDAIPLVVDGADAIIGQSDKLFEVYDGFQQFQKADQLHPRFKGEQRDKEAARKRQQGIAKMVQGFKEITEDPKVTAFIAQKVPRYLKDHETEIQQAVGKALAAPAVTKALKDQGVSKKMVLDALPLVIDGADTVLGQTDKLFQVYDGFMKFQRSSQLPDGFEGDHRERVEAFDRQQGIVQMLDGVAAIANDPKFVKLVAMKAPKFLEDHKQEIQDLAKHQVSKIPAAKNFGVTEKVIDNAVDIALQTAPGAMNSVVKILQHGDQLGGMYSAVDELRRTAGKDGGITSKNPSTEIEFNIAKFVSNGKKLLANTDIRDFVDGDLGHIIVQNNQAVKDIAVEIATNNPKIKSQLDKFGVTNKQLEQVVDIGVRMAPDVLPFATQFTEATLESKPEQLVGIVASVNAVRTAKSKGEKKAAINELIGSIAELRKENPRLAKMMDEELPDLLNKHSTEIGAMVDDLVHNTKIGKKLGIKSEQVLKIASKKLPELTKLVDLYAEGKYAKMVKPLAKIALSPSVIKLGVRAGLNLARNTIKGEKKVVEAAVADAAEEIAVGEGVKTWNDIKVKDSGVVTDLDKDLADLAELAKQVEGLNVDAILRDKEANRPREKTGIKGPTPTNNAGNRGRS